MQLLNQVNDADFQSRESKLLKFILKIVKDDDRLFDIEQAISQKCSRKVFETNQDIEQSLKVIINGDIDKIDDAYSKCTKVFTDHDISKDDYS